MVLLKVTAPTTPNVLPTLAVDCKLAAPVTLNVLERVVAPVTAIVFENVAFPV